MKIKTYNNYFLNEKIEEYDFGFKTVLDSKSVDYINEDSVIDKSKEQYIDSGDLTIDWEMDFDNRKYGINSMGIIVHKVHGYYTLVTPSENGKDLEEEIEFSFDNKESKDWDTQCDAGKFKFGHGLNPQNIEIDFKTKKIVLQF